MKIFYPDIFYNNSHRWHIFPLLKALEKETDPIKQGFEIVGSEQDAQVIILPMSWNYYYSKNLINDVLNYYKKLDDKKLVYSFVFGDIGCKVPRPYNGIVFRDGGLKSKLPSTHIPIPIFINDPISTYYPDMKDFSMPYSKVPIVGFCGLANKFGFDALKDISKRILKNVLSVFGLRNHDTDQLISVIHFRWRILKRIMKSKKIKSNFIIRNRYRAGIKSQKENHPTTLEFYKNIKESNYTVCMRGAGNFSTRLYETLAMGRIPVFVNTNCLLPLQNAIDWKEHVVWIEEDEHHLINEKILEFHQSLDENALNALFLKNRQLWDNKLRLYPFFHSIWPNNKR